MSPQSCVGSAVAWPTRSTADPGDRNPYGAMRWMLGAPFKPNKQTTRLAAAIPLKPKSGLNGAPNVGRGLRAEKILFVFGQEWSKMNVRSSFLREAASFALLFSIRCALSSDGTRIA
jgi:hypothetical protein